MNTKPVLLTTVQPPAAVEERMAREFTVRRLPPGVPLSADALLPAAEGAEALLVAHGFQLDAAFFARLPRTVRIVASYSVGYEHIDLAAARACGVAVSNTPGVLTDATAEMALLLLLAAARRATEGQALVRSGSWNESAPTMLSLQLSGHVLGIYGMGRIGQAVAQRARAFGMQIHYCNRRRLPPEQEAGAVFHDGVESLFPVSSFLSLHSPLTDETRHLLNKRNLKLLPFGAVVVNTARGGLVEDEALLTALHSGQVSAAGLDVFEGEPKVHPGYLALGNVFLMPHLGSATVQTRTAMGMLALDNVAAVLAGRPAPSLLVG